MKLKISLFWEDNELQRLMPNKEWLKAKFSYSEFIMELYIYMVVRFMAQDLTCITPIERDLTVT